MFSLDTPGIYELIHNTKIVGNSEELESFRKRGVVIISIIGQCHFHDKRGYKRAFRLVIDAFGSPTLFIHDEDENKQDSESVHDEGETTNEQNETAGEVKLKKQEEEAYHNFEDENAKISKDNIQDMSSKAIINKQDEKSQPRTEKKSYKTEDYQTLGSIEGFYVEEEGIIFLHHHGDQDPKTFLAEWQKLNAPESQGFPEVWASIKSKSIRSLLLLFSLSHVVLISSTAGFFDTSLIQTFRVLDTVRIEVLPYVNRVLSEIEGVSKAWRDHGRVCSPRILFLFECMNEHPRKVSRVMPDRKNPVKEQQYRLEEEIYHILRKCRVVTNISANSLFAIPSTEEYVFMYDVGVEKPELRDAPANIPFHLINNFCQKRIESMCDSSSYTLQPKSSATTLSTTANSSSTSNVPTPLCDMPRTYSDILCDFREFILAHSRLAHESGFDDDSKRVAEHKHFFVLPQFKSWLRAFQVLSDYFIRDIHFDSKNAKQALSCVDQLTSIDIEYLESQCAKMFPKVFAHYLKNLPEIYPEKVHQNKVTAAINILLKVSHGPGIRKWVEKLRKKCEIYWKNGRQQCEARSLKENSCCLALHRYRLEDHLEVLPFPQMDEKLPLRSHSTGRKYISYCNCGRSQGVREEPFTIRESNYLFYERMGQQNGCCPKLENYEFQVFTPPSPDYIKDTQEMLLRLQTRQRSDLYGVNDRYFNNQESSSQEGLEDELRQGSSLDVLDEYEDAVANFDPEKVNDIRGDVKSGPEDISSDEESENEDDGNDNDEDNEKRASRDEKTKETLLAKWEAGLKKKSTEDDSKSILEPENEKEKPIDVSKGEGEGPTNVIKNDKDNKILEAEDYPSCSSKPETPSKWNEKGDNMHVVEEKSAVKKDKTEDRKQQPSEKSGEEEEVDVDLEVKSLLDKLNLNENTTDSKPESPANVKQQQVTKKDKTNVGGEGTSRPQSASIPGSPTNEICDDEEEEVQDNKEASNNNVAEFLPGMLHSKSIPGLLPLFSSWSLVCLGSSSLYCHTSGITHQPGFLNGSSTLLPWDRLVKAEAGVSKPIPRLIRGRRPSTRVKRISDEFTVKIFMGMEFECKRGHRFLLEAPDKILQITTQGSTPNLKEAAHLVATSDIPLYYPCPCKDRDSREPGIVIAQLMRVHIVTPKAPVHVTVNPRVQPGPLPCPIFYPGSSAPIKLAPSSYWILRLPYSYVSDDQIFVPSTDVTSYNGKLLKGVVNVMAMSPAETKAWNLEA